VRACAERVLKLAARLGRFDNPVLADERADDLPEHRALIRRLGADGTVLLKNAVTNGSAALPLTLRPGLTVALIGRAATEAQAMGGGSANVNAHHRVAPVDALRAAHPDVRFVTATGADLFRYTPVLQQPLAVDFYDSEDLSGPVVLTEVSPNTEVMWNDRTPPGLTWGAFSARARATYVADADGVHQFSLISAGPARLRLDGVEVLDGWTAWARGDTYFTFGSDEIVCQRTMKAGERVSLEIDYTTARAEKTFYALRVGAARVLDASDVQAAVEVARTADLAIVFAGLNNEWDNEGVDRPGIDLPHHQNALVAGVAAANPRTVVVLQSGSPLALPWLDAVPAVLQAWYPGQECGHSIADVLTGAAEPGGRLPQTWPLRLEDTVAFGDAAQYPAVDGEVTYGEGVFIGYRHHDAKGLAPRFPFGFGLSYTSFAIEGLTLDRATLQPGETLTATVHVRNTGPRAGSEVVQLYVHDDVSSLPRPPQELKAFVKLTLQPGEAQTVSLSLGMRAFAAFDEARAAWVAEAGAFEVRVGRSSADLPLRAAVTLAADWVGAA
ncbi:MAG: glycoside hydrolase family 3 C-terminal domain-containing protein, partial [Leptothrix sp. (in: b-proteobacteria)]